MLRRGLFLILALGLCLPLASAAPTKPPAVSKEMQLKGAISEELAKLASWCLGKHLMPEGRALVDEALSLKADPEVQALKGRLAKEIKPYDDAQIRKDFEAKRTQMGKKLTGLYKDLFTQPHSADQQTAYDVYLLRAYDFDAKAIMPLVEAAIQDAGKRDDYPREKHLLEAAEALHDDPAWVKGLEILELRASNVKPILKKASTHPLQYKLSLPKGWTPDKRWPILVAVEGSGCNWDAYMNGFLSQRGDLPFIVVVPLTFSNTGLLNKDSDPYPKEILDKYNQVTPDLVSRRVGFEIKGVLAILEDLRKDYGGEEGKFFITGFSGGGVLAWSMALAHPELLEASAPACGVISGAIGIPGAPMPPCKVSEAPERETLPIRAFQGDKDPRKDTLFLQEWEVAKAICDEHGFKKVDRVMVPELEHNGCHRAVLDFFAGILKARKPK